MSSLAEADRRAAALAACLAAIDRAVERYHRQVTGQEPWSTTFAAPVDLASFSESQEGTAGGRAEHEEIR